MAAFPARVAIVDDSELPSAAKLAAALERAGFWEIATDQRARIVIKPEFAGFAANTPSITDPKLVEALIDLLCDRGFANVAVAGSADSSALWAENRDMFALADLMGYRFETVRGRAYDIVDLGDAAESMAFPQHSVLRGESLSSTWRDADIRIVFANNRTDEAAGYALCLDTLIGVLPRVDKDLHYRRRRDPGDVVTALLDAAPPHFCLIDAIVSAHGTCGQRAPQAAMTDTIIAATDPVLADYVGALKMGLDPAISPLFSRVAQERPLPRHYTISGSLAPYTGWVNVPELNLRTTQQRRSDTTLDRLVEPWLQRLDTELFPLKQPLDARMNATLSEYFSNNDWLFVLASALLGTIGQMLDSYRVLFNKDVLSQRSVPLGIDIDELPKDAFDRLVDELTQLEAVAMAAPVVSDELRWRSVEKSVVFNYARLMPIDFDVFMQKVDVARTIQFMNDYLGGIVIPLAHDERGRPIRQAERNIYLPQPNYLVLYRGKPIDVSKLEVVEYTDDRHRLLWRTIASENSSAVHDDGIATFQRTGDGTLITIMGRQQFTLPLFWQVFDLDIVPDLKAKLVTHAYQTFFDRTIANFEALVEGRDIRIGRPADEPTAYPTEQLMPLLRKIGDLAMPLIQRALQPQGSGGDTHRWTDPDGFTHVLPCTEVQVGEPDLWLREIKRFFEGFGHAVQRDLTRTA